MVTTVKEETILTARYCSMRLLASPLSNVVNLNGTHQMQTAVENRAPYK
jgi:hypothetical protein